MLNKIFNLQVLFAVLLISISSNHCEEFTDDLWPDSNDLRSQENDNFERSAPGNNIIHFNLDNVFGGSIRSEELLADTTKKSILFYFTMWCSSCNSHVQFIDKNIIDQHPDHQYILVDWISNKSADTRSLIESSGLQGIFDMIGLDKNQSMLTDYAGGMGTVVVIDRAGKIRLNETFKDGKRVIAILKKISSEFD